MPLCARRPTSSPCVAWQMPLTPCRSQLTVQFRAERSLVAMAQREAGSGRGGPRLWLLAEGRQTPCIGPLLSELPDSERLALELCSHALDHRGALRTLYLVEGGFILGPWGHLALRSSTQHAICVTEELLDARQRLPQQCRPSLMDTLATHARRHLKAKRQRSQRQEAHVQARERRCGAGAAASLDEALTARSEEAGPGDDEQPLVSRLAVAPRTYPSPPMARAATSASTSVPAAVAGALGVTAPSRGKAADCTLPLSPPPPWWMAWMRCVQSAVERCSRGGGASAAASPRAAISAATGTATAAAAAAAAATSGTARRRWDTSGPAPVLHTRICLTAPPPPLVLGALVAPSESGAAPPSVSTPPTAPRARHAPRSPHSPSTRPPWRAPAKQPPPPPLSPPPWALAARGWETASKCKTRTGCGRWRA